MRPIIGVTCSVDQDALRLNMNYYQALERAGALPILIPILQHPENLFQLAEILDGILFSGGVDIDPHHYGEEPRMGLGQITPERDKIEIELCKIFFEKKKPIFGICRGVQLINVALGGTLHQDVKSELKDVLKHYQEAPAYAPTHTVFIERDSLVFSIVGSEKLLVNSFHHQAIKMVSPFLKVVARASDGVIEAVESFDQDRFVLGVQWHPERMFEKHIEHFKLFDHFVKECSKRKR